MDCLCAELCMVYCALCIVFCVLRPVSCVSCIVSCVVRIVFCALCIVQFELCIVYCCFLYVWIGWKYGDVIIFFFFSSRRPHSEFLAVLWGWGFVLEASQCHFTPPMGGVSALSQTVFSSSTN